MFSASPARFFAEKAPIWQQQIKKNLIKRKLSLEYSEACFNSIVYRDRYEDIKLMPEETGGK